MIKKEHPRVKGIFATEDGRIWYDNGKPISTNHNGTREKFAVKKDGKSVNFGLRRFIWECMTGEELDKNMIVTGKENSNAFKDLKVITKSQQASEVYTEIWRKKKHGNTK